LWRSRWNVDWQEKPKFSEKTCPSAIFVHHKIPHDQTRIWTRAAAVGRSSHLRLGLPSSLSSSGFPIKIVYASRFSPMRATFPAHVIPWLHCFNYTLNPVLNGPFIKRNFVLNGNIFRSRHYHSIPWLIGNMASAEKCSGPLRFRLRQVLLGEEYMLWSLNNWKRRLNKT
jgi:hypothetical protein